MGKAEREEEVVECCVVRHKYLLSVHDDFVELCDQRQPFKKEKHRRTSMYYI